MLTIATGHPVRDNPRPDEANCLFVNEVGNAVGARRIVSCDVCEGSMGLINALVAKQKLLKKRLRIAGIRGTPEEYVRKSLKNSVMVAVFTFGFLFLVMSKNQVHLLEPIVGGLVLGFGMYQLNMRKVDVAIRKRAREIDREVLFAGRFLLIKLNSGKPLVTAIEEAAKGKGAATEYFQNIMRSLHLGTPLEKALERATEYCPSEYMRKILFQITNALKIGVDVTNFLESILDEISEYQLTEILRYSKKLSSLTMFYMLGAVIVPSLGMTLFVVVASLVSLNIDMTAFGLIVGLLFIVQFIFITVFKSSRPIMDV